MEVSSSGEKDMKPNCKLSPSTWSDHNKMSGIRVETRERIVETRGRMETRIAMNTPALPAPPFRFSSPPPFSLFLLEHQMESKREDSRMMRLYVDYHSSDISLEENQPSGKPKKGFVSPFPLKYPSSYLSCFRVDQCACVVCDAQSSIL